MRSVFIPVDDLVPDTAGMHGSPGSRPVAEAVAHPTDAGGLGNPKVRPHAQIGGGVGQAGDKSESTKVVVLLIIRSCISPLPGHFSFCLVHHLSRDLIWFYLGRISTRRHCTETLLHCHFVSGVGYTATAGS